MLRGASDPWSVLVTCVDASSCRNRQPCERQVALHAFALNGVPACENVKCHSPFSSVFEWPAPSYPAAPQHDTAFSTL